VPNFIALGQLSRVELDAARLDGDVYRLGDDYLPIDTIETPAHRLRAALAGLPEGLAAERGTAAWVWGALPRPPAVAELCVVAPSRVRLDVVPPVVLREVVLPPEDLVRLAGAAVTSPLRTALDLARTREGWTEGDTAALARLAELGRFRLEEAVARLSRPARLPGMARARLRLREALPP